MTVDVSVSTFTVPLVSVAGWVVVHQRVDGSMDFNRSWAEYRNGFGDAAAANGSFWLGNEAIHQLTVGSTGSCRLRVEVLTSITRQWYSAEYDRFSVDKETNSYAISVAGYSGDAGDAMNVAGTDTSQNGEYFSTFDHLPLDWNSNRLKCALVDGGGWWFNNCGKNCFTCVYNVTNKAYIWGTISSSRPYTVLAMSRMMVKCT